MPEHLQQAYATRITEPHYIPSPNTAYVAHQPSADSNDADKSLVAQVAGIREMDSLRAFWTAMTNKPAGSIADYIA